MSLCPGGKQPFMRETFIHRIGRPQLLTLICHLRGKQKGVMQVLKERNLWPKNGRHSDGFSFLLQCSKDSNRTGCSPDKGEHGCCARSVLAAEPTSKSKRADYRKDWSLVDSWLFFTPSFTVNSILLSGTDVAASGMLEKIASIP